MLLEANQLTKSYRRGDREIQALRGVSLSLKKGEFVAVVGPSGSGKSTILHLLGGLDLPTSGSVSIEGRAIEGLSDAELSAFRRRKLGFIFQFFNLVPTLTALENAALPSLLDGKTLSSVAPQAEALLKQMGLAERTSHRPDQLSGGEMQRVAIARALLADTAVILADEPTGNLDSATGAAVLDLLASSARQRGRAVLMVTHDAAAAARADRVIRVKDGLIDA